MHQKEPIADHPTEDPELEIRTRSGEDEDGEDPPATKSGRRAERI